MLDRTTSSPRSTSQETTLLDYVERLERIRAGRIGVRINFSLLAPAYRRDNYIRIATETFTQSVSSFGGNIFIMRNSDIFFITRDITLTTLDAVVNRLRVLFSDDPLVQYNEAEKQTNPEKQFCVFYRLETDYAALVSSAKEYVILAEQIKINPELDPISSQVKPLSPVRPELLAKLEQALEKADVTNVVRRQTVCSLFESDIPKPLFEEIFVSIEDLQKVTTPGVDLLSNRWLFRYLTSTLDKRVLNMLIKDGTHKDKPFSLNLNVSTILSPEFMRFEELITPQLRGRLVIEMNKVDVFSDMGTFLFARDYLRDHGFRICLDGLTHHTLSYFDRSKLGFDLIKVYWTPDSIDNMLPEMVPALRSVIMETGQARTILCRCESAKSVEVGQQLGIVMFQGRYIERLLSQSRAAPQPVLPPIIIRSGR